MGKDDTKNYVSHLYISTVLDVEKHTRRRVQRYSVTN